MHTSGESPSNHELLADLRDPTHSLRDAIPDVWAGFTSLHRAAVAEGAVPARLKEAAALAMAVVTHCDGCIAYHARAAAETGAQPMEVAEMLGIALLMDGGPASVYAPRAWAAYLEFSDAASDPSLMGSILRARAAILTAPEGGVMTEVVAWFDELSKNDTWRAGGKGANLGELTRAGLPVPAGFVVTADAYLHAMEEGGVRAELRQLATAIDASDQGAVERAADRLRALVHKAGVPNGIRRAVVAAYRRMGDEDASVAVRSSATAEDTDATSFAGMHETFTNVVGEDALLARLVDCWASLFGPRVVAYRASRGVTDEPAIAVVVQRMVHSERSGVMFTADPSTGDRSAIVVEGAFGLGEVVVGGQVEPDTYVLAKDGPRLLRARVGHKSHKIVRGADGSDTRVELSGDDALRRVLTDDEAVELARLGLRVEDHYGAPQDTEWAIAGGQAFLVQSRPITTLVPEGTGAGGTAASGAALVSGLAASPGLASGRVRVLTSPTEGVSLQTGEILVAPMTSPRLGAHHPPGRG